MSEIVGGSGEKLGPDDTFARKELFSGGDLDELPDVL
jgi:hypothetical protein